MWSSSSDRTPADRDWFCTLWFPIDFVHFALSRSQKRKFRFVALPEQFWHSCLSWPWKYNHNAVDLPKIFGIHVLSRSRNRNFRVVDLSKMFRNSTYVSPLDSVKKSSIACNPTLLSARWHFAQFCSLRFTTGFFCCSFYHALRFAFHRSALFLSFYHSKYLHAICRSKGSVRPLYLLGTCLSFYNLARIH